MPELQVAKRKSGQESSKQVPREGANDELDLGAIAGAAVAAAAFGVAGAYRKTTRLGRNAGKGSVIKALGKSASKQVTLPPAPNKPSKSYGTIGKDIKSYFKNIEELAKP